MQLDGPTITASRHYPREATIFRQGDRSRGWYEVVDGVARVCQFRTDGRRQVLAFAVPGDVMGLEQGRRECCAEALTPMTLIFHPFLDGADDVHLPWDRVVRDNHQRMTLLGMPNALGRVGAFILYMSRRLGNRLHFSLPMSRIDIADHLGLTMHTVSRTLRHLARHGLIRIEANHQFEVVAAERLAAMCGIDPHDFQPSTERLVA